MDIVGRGWEEKKEELSEYKQVNIIGTVDDVSYWYHKYPALVMPIRRGSGIKVKTAEAIMYGKTIFASDEALEGYDVNEIKGIYRCNDAKEYIDNIMSFFTGKEIPLCQDDVRKLYLKKYSSDHLYNCTATFFECIDSGSIH